MLIRTCIVIFEKFMSGPRLEPNFLALFKHPIYLNTHPISISKLTNGCMKTKKIGFETRARQEIFSVNILMRILKTNIKIKFLVEYKHKSLQEQQGAMCTLNLQRIRRKVDLREDIFVNCLLSVPKLLFLSI